ncbi:MAG: sigma-70 family RNA polymerase sigma factor [Thermomicrobiales bacterium]
MTVTRLPDDAELLAALRRGDEAAFVQLVERYQGPLVRLARLFVADQTTAEEVVQETWLGALRGLDRFEGRSSLKTWLFNILTNRAKTRAVRDGRTIPFSALMDATEGGEQAVDPDRFHPLPGTPTRGTGCRDRRAGASCRRSDCWRARRASGCGRRSTNCRRRSAQC